MERGRATIEKLIGNGGLEPVKASIELSELLMDDAGKHLVSARLIASSDPTGAYQLAHDAARKACSALLASQGLRATTRGGHVAVQDAVRAQFNGDGGTPAFRAFPRLRRTRAAPEYPDASTPTATVEDVADAIDAAAAMETAARQILGTGRVDRFLAHR